MSDNSTIEWTDATWNPVRGCVKISPGCKNCYAETFAERFRSVAGHPYEQGFDPRLIPEKLLEPLRWAKPKRVFVNSMSDLFLDFVPDEYIIAVADVMRSAPWHTFQVLTKRASRMATMLRTKLAAYGALPHIWWGVSVEDKTHGLPRIDEIRHAPAVTRFLSVEPLLEDLGGVDLSGIHWMIVGGESGHGGRKLEQSWVESLRLQCADRSIPFFFKQWGGVQKGRNGRLLHGRTYDELPHIRPNAELPTLPVRRRLIEDFTQLGTSERWTDGRPQHPQ
jgi:protein gp37